MTIDPGKQGERTRDTPENTGLVFLVSLLFTCRDAGRPGDVRAADQFSKVLADLHQFEGLDPSEASGKTNPLRSRSRNQEKSKFQRRSQYSSNPVVNSTMLGQCGWSLTTGCEKQARARPKRKGGARRVSSLIFGIQCVRYADRPEIMENGG
jgi:hypothetical protein